MKNGTIYIGVTSNLRKRIWEHKNKLVDGFTKKYAVDKLVYFRRNNQHQICHQQGKTTESVEEKLENCLNREN